MAALTDNIAHETVEETTSDPQTDDAEMQEYLEKFDKITALKDKLGKLYTAVATPAAVSNKVAPMSAYLAVQDKYNEEILELLIMMNNVFGKAK